MESLIDVLKTKSLLVPSSTSTVPHATEFPTVLPPKPIMQVATDSGTRTLWVVFVIMLLSSAAFTVMSWRIPVSRRLYHVLTTVITITAAISYFGMATKSGVNYHHIHKTEKHTHKIPDTHQEIIREVYWARYVDWSLTTPLLLLDLCLLAGMSGGHIVMAILADLIMILTGLFAAYGSTPTQKWGWYAIACIAYLFVVWHLVVNGRAVAQAKGSKVGKFFAAISLYTLVLWTAYPIVWGVADGARIASVNQEIVAYAVLDVLAKPVFGFWLLITHSQLPGTNIDLGGFWTHGIGSEGSLRVGDDDEGA